MHKRFCCIVAVALLLTACRDAAVAPATTPEEEAANPAAVVLDRLAPPRAALGAIFSNAKRTALPHGLAHYAFDVRLGPGQYDVVRLHRVVRERRPHRPERTRGAVFMVHGALQGFEDIYLWESAGGDPRVTAAGYLASEGIDVWGIDLSWTLIPLQSSPALGFMESWDVEREVDHVLAGMSIARLLRGISGQGFGRIPLLGFSYSVPLVYAAAGRETQQWPLLRDIDALVAVDGFIKFGPADEAHRVASCNSAAAIATRIAGGMFHQEDAQIFVRFGDLAATAPDDPSPLIPGLTNFQALLAVGVSPRGTPAEFWHFVAGEFDEIGRPVGLRFTNTADWMTIARSLPPYMTLVAPYEINLAACDEADVLFDDHLGAISVPILYIGAAGGLGAGGVFSTTLTGSRDVRHHVVHIPGSPPLLDYGHADLFLARNAPELVWNPLRDWLIEQGQSRNRPRD